MKRTFRNVVIGLLTVIACVSLCACGLSGDGDNGGKTKLLVFNYDGGYGTEWLRNAEKEYEKLHGDVDIQIQAQKTSNGAISADGIKTNKCNVFFIEQTSYASYIAKDVVSDITDILTSENPYDGKTILGKFTDQQKNYYKVNDKYYGIPHYAGNNGFVYNKTLFDKNGWYFKKNKPTEENPPVDDWFISKASDEKSLGPNGKTGTIDGIDYSWDDGLPATYDEFILLLDYIKSFSISNFKPLTFTGGSREQYIGLLYNALVGDYEGDEMLLNYGFDGTATDLGRIVDGEFVKDEQPTVISENNGYELARQEGKYKALKFLNEIFNEKSYYDVKEAVNGSDSNVKAQTRFLRGQSAILIEGVWWESESYNEGTFDLLGKSKTDYNFGWMPLPKGDESKVGTETVVDNIYSLCIVKSGLSEKQMAIVKDFLQFVYSDKMLSAFTRDTGTLRALNYEVNTDDFNALSEYGKSVYKHKQNAKTVYPIANNAIFRNNQADFFPRTYYATDYKVGNVESYKYVSKMLLDDYIGGSQVTPDVEKYFSGMYTYYMNKWSDYKA